MSPQLVDPARHGPGQAPQIRALTTNDAQAYKELLVALFAEFPQDGDAKSEGAKPVTVWAQMMENSVRRGGAYFGLFKNGELVAAVSLNPRHMHTRVELSGPGALPTERDPAMLSPLVRTAIEAARKIPGVTHLIAEIDPSIKYLQAALYSSGFQQYGLLPRERIVDGQAFDAQFLYLAIGPERAAAPLPQ